MPISATEIRQWVIYKITSPSGRIYIGKSADLSTRKSAYKHTSGAVKDQRIVYNSILKYGFDKHVFEVIDSFCGGNDYAANKEKSWIAEYKSNHNRWPLLNGMNLTDGGDGALGCKHSKESIEIRASKRRGKKLSPEQIAHLSEYNKANPSRSMLGKKHTADAKRKMSIAKKGKPMSHINNCKPIVRYSLTGDLIKEYPSTVAAAKDINGKKGTINSVLKGKRKRAYQSVFKYKYE